MHYQLFSYKKFHHTTSVGWDFTLWLPIKLEKRHLFSMFNTNKKYFIYLSDNFFKLVDTFSSLLLCKSKFSTYLIRLTFLIFIQLLCISNLSMHHPQVKVDLHTSETYNINYNISFFIRIDLSWFAQIDFFFVRNSHLQFYTSIFHNDNSIIPYLKGVPNFKATKYQYARL